MTAELITCTIGEVKRMIHGVVKDPNTKNLPFFISGPPGIGKTDLGAQLAKDLGADYRAYLTSTMDPTDVVGVPSERDGVTHFCPPANFLALTYDCEKVGILPDRPIVASLEDLPSCNPHVLNALLRFLCNGEIADSRLRDNVLIIATGNRVEDKAGAIQIPTALANRFVHVEVKVDKDQWIQWAQYSNIDPLVISFIEKTGIRSLHNFDPSSGHVAFPTPRSVAMASNLIRNIGYEDTKIMKIGITGCVGSAWAIEFLTYSKIRLKVIPIEEIFKDPNNAPIPAAKDLDIQFATINSLIMELISKFSVDRFFCVSNYLGRMKCEECTVFGLKKLLNIIYDENFRKQLSGEDKDTLTNSPEWGSLTKKYKIYLGQ